MACSYRADDSIPSQVFTFNTTGDCTQVNGKITVTLNQTKALAEIGKALGTETRIAMLQLLQANSLNIKEIADKLQIPISTAASNIKTLEDAGLIITNYQPGVRGSMKLCGRRINEITILLDLRSSDHSNVTTQNMPIGAFTDCSVKPTCGMASHTEIITENVPGEFFTPQRTQAQLLWFAKGFIEYKFSNTIKPGQRIKKISIAAEICSEAPKFRMDWPSDITLWINDVDVGTWVSPGDFGDRRGTNNPSWWPEYNTQYGCLKTWVIDERGTFLDDEILSGVTLDQVSDQLIEHIRVKFGIKDNAKNVGGINLFGEGFGDYEQNIVMRIEYCEAT